MTAGYGSGCGVRIIAMWITVWLGRLRAVSVWFRRLRSRTVHSRDLSGLGA